MVFSSIPFLFFFLPLFLLLYFLVPKKLRNLVLLIFSLIFYAWGEPIYIILMLFSSLVDYINGILLNKFKNSKLKKRLVLIFSIVVNLSLLSIFKYSGFIITTINDILGTSISNPNLPLPIGISFYTFQTMSYTIDVYMGRVKYERNFLNFFVYVSMFPQLIAGPIVRYEDISRELSNRTVTFEDYKIGFTRFLRGLFKKVLLANNMGLLWSIISSYDINNISVLTSWLGIIAYSFQIYFDFSGYSDMAIGIGKMLGFSYPENFNYPYISKSITEFWRRWHMSLSTWFKDYVYIPLGGNRCSRGKHIRNILIVWLLTGLWHGSSWNFIMWGLYFGIILLLEKFIYGKALEKLPKVFSHIYALILIIIGWLIFAFTDVNMIKDYFFSMFGLNGNVVLDNNFIFYTLNNLVFLIACIIFSIPIKIKSNKFISIITTIMYIILFILVVAFLVSDTYNPFLYFRF